MPSSEPIAPGLEAAENGSAETELIDRARTGDQRAFGELVEAQRDRMWAICLRITGNPHDAEDALQDALVAAWRAIGRYRGDAKLSTWLFRIASNAALAQIRKRPDTDDIDDHQPVSTVDFTSGIVLSDRIQDALSRVPDAYRATFVLRVYGDLSYAEIAEAQGIGVQTVRSRISRARDILQDLLADVR
ncbi:sigma-70 family RNA polymerase sigma factor [Gordonia sp. NPDC003585]|uniref:RNA polymerase sigma factor n=1 Tax=unclassified Gordonia (in: high G+C Gram-positive bacteria) TaxID=2657482 RepID=UPI0033B5ED29